MPTACTTPVPAWQNAARREPSWHWTCCGRRGAPRRRWRLQPAAPFSINGWPVVVLRVGTSEEGLPIGIQLVGKPFQEHVVLAVAGFLEREFGGFMPPAI